jgi:hypothetical protein
MLKFLEIVVSNNENKLVIRQTCVEAAKVRQYHGNPNEHQTHLILKLYDGS